jgi:ligand-binding sensor domain-containing protein
MMAVITGDAQQANIRFVNFGTKDGLGDKYIYKACQDSNGTMWFGTSTGLYYYDNKRFRKIIAPNGKDGRSINNILNCVYYDEGLHKIWCASRNYILLYNPYTKKFSTPNYEIDALQKIADLIPKAVQRDRKGTVFISTEADGVFYAAKNATSFNRVQNLPSNVACNRISLTSNNEVWVTTGAGLFEISSGKGVCYKPAMKKAGYDYYNGHVYSKDENCLWVGSSGQGLYHFDLATHTFTNYPQPEYVKGQQLNNGYHGEYGNSANLLWVHTNKLFNKLTKQYITKADEEGASGTNNSRISSIFVDKENNMWFCTHGGLSMLPWQNQFIATVKHKLPDLQVYFEYYHNHIYKNGDALFAPLNMPALYRFENGSSNYLTDLGVSVCVANTVQQQALLASTKGIFIVDQGAQRVKQVYKQIPQSMYSAIQSMWCISDTQILLSVADKGFYYASTTCSPKLLHAYYKGFERIEPHMQGAHQEIWCSSDSGIFVCSAPHYVPKHIQTSSPLNKILDVCSNGNGTLWCTSLDQGLIRLDMNKEKYSVTYLNSNTSNQINGSFAVNCTLDDNGLLWTGFADGLYAFNSATNDVIFHLGITNGLSYEDAVRKLSYAHDKLYLNRWSGFDIIDLQKLKSNRYKSKLLLHQLFLYKDTLGAWPQSTLHMPSNKGFISLEVGSTGYNNGDQNRIQYRLLPADTTWREASNTGLINYSALAAGTYELQIRLYNNNQFLCDERQIKFTVAQVLYKRWWFLLASAVLLIFFVYYFYKQKIQRARTEARLRAEFSQQLAETEMRALRAQMNPHFIFNCLNSINKFILQKDTVAASQYLTKFSRLIRLILDDSNESMVSLYSEMELLRLYLEMESMRFDKKFRYLLSADADLNMSEVLLPSMLIQPYIENAIWHGLLHLPEAQLVNARIDISFKAQQDQLLISIEDNGVGRVKAAELKSKSSLKRKSYGMKLTEKRLRMMNEVHYVSIGVASAQVSTTDLYHKSGEAAGTRVEIILPLQQNTTGNE